MWQPIPYLGSVEPSGKDARNADFAASGGAEGVVTPTALEVRALASPGTSVRIAPGTVAVLNRDPGAGDQMYVAYSDAEETIAVPATGSGIRSDLVVVRIEADNETPGPYTRLITDVPSDTTTADTATTGRTEYAVARIDLPAYTSTILPGMIVDLRSLTPSAQVTERVTRTLTPVERTDLAAGGGFTEWPSDLLDVTIPPWATHARGTALVIGARFGATGDNAGAGWSATGDLRIQFGWVGDPGYSTTTPFALTSGGGAIAATLAASADAVAIPASKRGGAMTVLLEGSRDAAGATTADLYVDERTVLLVDLEFYADTESNG